MGDVGETCIEGLDAVASAGSFGVSPAGSAEGSIPANKPTWGAGVAKCVHDCGPPVPFSQLANSASEKGPRWPCNPCNSAGKALEAAPLSKEAERPRPRLVSVWVSRFCFRRGSRALVSFRGSAALLLSRARSGPCAGPVSQRPGREEGHGRDDEPGKV